MTAHVSDTVVIFDHIGYGCSAGTFIDAFHLVATLLRTAMSRTYSECKARSSPSGIAY